MCKITVQLKSTLDSLYPLCIGRSSNSLIVPSQLNVGRNADSHHESGILLWSPYYIGDHNKFLKKLCTSYGKQNRLTNIMHHVFYSGVGVMMTLEDHGQKLVTNAIFHTNMRNLSAVTTNDPLNSPSHPGQLSLLPSAKREMSTSQSAISLCGWQ